MGLEQLAAEAGQAVEVPLALFTVPVVLVAAVQRRTVVVVGLAVLQVALVFQQLRGLAVRVSVGRVVLDQLAVVVLAAAVAVLRDHRQQQAPLVAVAVLDLADLVAQQVRRAVLEGQGPVR